MDNLIRLIGKLVHDQYLHRPTCPYELSCLKNYLEANLDELFTNPDCARIATELMCIHHSNNPDGCPYYSIVLNKQGKIEAKFGIAFKGFDSSRQ